MICLDTDQVIDLQAERQPKKALTEIAYRLWTEKDSFSRKVGLEKDSFTGPQVPKIRTSHPDEDRAQTRDRVPGMSQQSQVLQPPTLFQSARQIPAKKPQRVFHLSRAQADLPFVPGHRGSGVHKRKREAKNKLATFIEGPRAIKKARSILDLNQSAEKNRVHDEGQNQKRENEAADLDQTVQPARQPPRKRPGASVAERKWRAETWAKKNAELDTPEQAATIQQNEAWTESSLKLAQKLHKFGLQETQPESAEKDTTEQQQEPTRVHLNHKPKVPADFHADHHPDGASRGSDMPPDTSTVPDEDEDYVMDVYVIETGNAEPSTMTSRMTVDASKPSLPSPESIGIIVIAEDEEDLWREFAELEHDEHDQNSEEEDENGTDPSLFLSSRSPPLSPFSPPTKINH
jgi:hypothetical protein